MKTIMPWIGAVLFFALLASNVSAFPLSGGNGAVTATVLGAFDMKMGLTHIYATAISAVDVFTTEYPAFSSNLIIDRSFLFVARSLASSAPVS